ncbi:MAG: Spy/CpxP family protein refolding chaperone [Steroidobacteraceae bacterium]
MKSIRKVLTATLLAAGAALAAATGMSIAGAAEQAVAPPPPGPHGWHHGPWHLLAKLDLNAAQKLEIKDIMTTAHPQLQSLREQMRANSLKLQQTKPTDPNYANIAAAASQTHGSLSAQMMSQRSEIRAQVFKVLTPAQQTQLAALEAEAQANMQAHAHGPMQ